MRVEFVLIKTIKDYIKTKPFIYDVAVRIKRGLGIRNQRYRLIDAFSKANKRRVNFIQIGANNGIHHDPIREFIVRDKWNGVLVEPLPEVFKELQINYRHVKGAKLKFVNAAISSSAKEAISFWTFNSRLLSSFTKEERLEHLRKSSFCVEHLKRHCKNRLDLQAMIREIKVPCLTLIDLFRKYTAGTDVDLLVIDAEGHEPEIICSIDFNILHPPVIFFETHTLGKQQDDIFELLLNNGYQLSVVDGDTIAFKNSMVKVFSKFWH